ADLAGFEQGFTVPVRPKLAESAHPFDFVMRKRRKCLFMARKRDRSRAGRRTSRDVCTHCRCLKKKHTRAENKPCHLASDRDFPRTLLAMAFLRWRYLGRRRCFRKMRSSRCGPWPATSAA